MPWWITRWLLRGTLYTVKTFFFPVDIVYSKYYISNVQFGWWVQSEKTYWKLIPLGTRARLPVQYLQFKSNYCNDYVVRPDDRIKLTQKTTLGPLLASKLKWLSLTLTSLDNWLTKIATFIKRNLGSKPIVLRIAKQIWFKKLYFCLTLNNSGRVHSLRVKLSI